MRVPRGFSAAEDKLKVFCTRPPLGDSASIRGWCSHTPTASAPGNAVRTRRRVPTAPDPTQRNKATNPLLGVVYLLTTGDLIRVRLPVRSHVRCATSCQLNDRGLREPRGVTEHNPVRLVLEVRTPVRETTRVVMSQDGDSPPREAFHL
jgi:hypothetical protein